MLAHPLVPFSHPNKHGGPYMSTRKEPNALTLNEASAAPMQHFTSNLRGATLRRDTMEGRHYLVAPMVMLTEGVHEGSNGPLLYPAEELAKLPGTWNHKPVVVYHPEINGQGVSACDPKILTKQKVGVVMNTQWDAKAKKLRAEAWLEEERCADVDPRVLEFLTSNRVMELSTGLFTENEESEGTFNGVVYNAVARTYRPDHLALLPDRVGACSVAKGAGLLQTNEMSHGSISQMLFSLMRDKLKRGLGEDSRWEGWIEDIFDSTFVYSDSGKLYQQKYLATETSVTLVDEPEQVVRHITYKPVGATPIGNSDATEKEVVMDKTKVVNGLISNKATKWEEGDRAFLMGMPDPQLQKLEDSSAQETTETTQPATPPAAPVTPPGTPVGAPAVAPVGNEGNRPMTAAEYIASAPPEVQAVLNHGLHAHNTEKARLIGIITANKVYSFTPQYLNERSIPELVGLAALAGATQAPPPAAPGYGMPNPNYFGAAAPAPTGNASQGGEEPPLLLPTMNFSKDNSAA